MTKPRPLAVLMVRLSVLFLSAGPARDRYRRELLTEQHDLERPDQLRHAVGVLSRAWSLRRAIAGGSTLDVAAAASARVAPLHCRAHLYHRFRLASTEDGHRYRRCVGCGKDSPTVGNGPGDWMSPVSMVGWH